MFIVVISVFLIKDKIIIFELSMKILKLFLNFRNLRDYFFNYKFFMGVHIF